MHTSAKNGASPSGRRLFPETFRGGRTCGRTQRMMSYSRSTQICWNCVKISKTVARLRMLTAESSRRRTTRDNEVQAGVFLSSSLQNAVDVLSGSVAARPFVKRTNFGFARIDCVFPPPRIIRRSSVRRCSEKREGESVERRCAVGDILACGADAVWTLMRGGAGTRSRLNFTSDWLTDRTDGSSCRFGGGDIGYRSRRNSPRSEVDATAFVHRTNDLSVGMTVARRRQRTGRTRQNRRIRIT